MGNDCHHAQRPYVHRRAESRRCQRRDGPAVGLAQLPRPVLLLGHVGRLPDERPGHRQEPADAQDPALPLQLRRRRDARHRGEPDHAPLPRRGRRVGPGRRGRPAFPQPRQAPPGRAPLRAVHPPGCPSRTRGAQAGAGGTDPVPHRLRQEGDDLPRHHARAAGGRRLARLRVRGRPRLLPQRGLGGPDPGGAEPRRAGRVHVGAGGYGAADRALLHARPAGPGPHPLGHRRGGHGSGAGRPRRLRGRLRPTERLGHTQGPPALQ
mmetsp:Transcript_65776/g.176231  ORF Transcript_65776/g.176231 Transcript_65776/m.176231 type:complete len:265 (-) Transcript_65776:244-1038(-)